jgi:YbbR domain-containing protein
MVKLPAEDARQVTVRPTVVQVTVRGDRQLLDDLSPKAIEAEIDLTGIESARLLQKKIEIHLPPRIVYTRIVPDEVEVIVPPKE